MLPLSPPDNKTVLQVLLAVRSEPMKDTEVLLKQTTTRLPPAEYALLERCRAMSEEISRIQANLSLARSLPCAASPVALLSEHGVQSHRERIAQQEQRLEALKAEFAPVREQAQRIADKVRSSSFRRFCELYCIDGIDLCFVPEFCGCSQRSADRYAALIHNTTTD